MSWNNPLSRKRFSIPFREEGDELWLLTPQELSEAPRDGSVTVTSIMGDRLTITKGTEPDTDTRDFRLPDGERVALTAWGVHESECA